MAKAIFYDPKLKRWRLLRRIFDVLGVAITLVVIVFVVSILRGENLPNVLLPQPVRPYRALKEKERRRPRPRPVRRRSTRKPSQVPLNSVEGIRAAYYVQWDAASYASLKEYLSQIDLLFPEWLHMLSPDGKLQAVTAENHFFDVINGSSVRAVDDKVMRLLTQEKAETEVFPLVNNFNTRTGNWMSGELGQMLSSADARNTFRRQVALFLSSERYRGLCLDFEDVPTASQPGFRALVSELNADLHGRGMKLYVNLPADDDDYDYGYIARHSDGIILMDYDEHSSTTGPGPVASQDFFTRNVQNVLKVVPRDKLIVAIGAYGYDWTAAVPATGHGKHKQPGRPQVVQDISVQTAWLHAQESEADVDFDGDSLNPHYAYEDEQSRRHDVWYLSAVTALNQMRAAQQLGVTTFALWRLGSEDRSLWAIWDVPGEPLAPGKLQDVPPGQDVDYEGHGEILRITEKPTHGKRKVTVDPQTGLITSEDFSDLPTPYQVEQYGASSKDLAITFDDGPDPKWTPLLLNALKRENIKATFFVIGVEAEQFPGLVKRMYDEGHEIGNHTWSHPDISNISRRFMSVEMNLPERWFSAYVGIHPLYFRPPYSIDQEPDTADQVRPLEITQSLGYITVGDKIDPNDWKENPRPSAEKITESIVYQLDHDPVTGNLCDPRPCGNVILLHDGGGNRSETVRAIPMIARELRARGYNLVPVSALIHKTPADVMPPIPEGERWSARVNLVAFWMLGSVYYWFIPWVFRLGDVLMSARLLIIGLLAILDRLIRHRRANGKTVSAASTVSGDGHPPYQPAVAILIPAYNEEKVIERTIRAALRSDYPHLRVICIDDGSSDNTLEVARDAFRREIAEGRVLVLAQPNSGKAEALNHGLQHVHEPIFVGIDADTVIARSAVSQLVPNFTDPEIGAIAGNAKVGNRVNLWTRWQALEYITSQNFERRALNILGAVSVVPGAIGAWRTQAVRDSGGFHVDTVAEDADLTMSLLQSGYRVEYDDRALAYTEAPISANGLMRQRFRWSFGILQAVWKHKAAFRRGGKLGWIALPNILIFQILLPLVSPFIDIMFFVGAISYAINRHFHPDSTNPADFYRLVMYFLAFLIIDFLASAIAFLLERKEARQKEDLFLLSQVWLQRFAYRQLFSIVLFKTLKRAIDGRPFSWDKLERTAAPLPMARV